MKIGKRLWIAATILVAYATFQLMADVAATKLIAIELPVLGFLILPGGTFVFAITFTLRDLIHKQLGLKVARAVVIVSALFNLFTAAYLAWVGTLATPDFYQFDQWGAIFAIAPAIALASIFAEITSGLIDTQVYQWAWVKGLPQWFRVVASNTVAAPIDSIVFTFFAFTLLPLLFGGESRNFAVALQLAIGGAVLKWIIGVLSMPLIYLIPEREVGTSLLD